MIIRDGFIYLYKIRHVYNRDGLIIATSLDIQGNHARSYTQTSQVPTGRTKMENKKRHAGDTQSLRQVPSSNF